MSPDPETSERRAEPPQIAPLDVDGVRTVTIGTALWLVAFLALLPFYGRLSDDGHAWWLWTCLAGCGLGAFGIEWCRRIRDQRQREERAGRG